MALRPGDVLLLTVADTLSMSTMAHLQEQFAAKFPDNRMIIAENGAKLSVLRPHLQCAPDTHQFVTLCLACGVEEVTGTHDGNQPPATKGWF